ncbi:sensor histidine kinase [Spirosoma linguale]|uniref:histidine kinase n=1 Tax=Spirosoma linguale (strain ATCC 33905 / DSM 74 / LMG 10896 / Claus 1) TaxID=504472 RepID=D2QGK0_SPILD|nr:histidine kinase [Spirosoma linguale DSM 74]
MRSPFLNANRRFYMSLYGKLALTLLALLTALACVYGYLTAYSAIRYFDATHQRLNVDVAAHIATFTKPFLTQGVNQAGADDIFFNAMVTNPSAEVYLLDSTGRVLVYHAPATKIKRSQVSLEPIREFISQKGKVYIKGDDPRSVADQKIFSVAEVRNNSRMQGYVYVILGGEQYGSVMESLLQSHVLLWGLLTLLITLTAALLIGLISFHRLTRGMEAITVAVGQFRQGDYLARVQVKASRELALVADTFNDMADELSRTITNLTQSERIRRELVASISHDLRTPITAIHGYADALTTNTLPEDTRHQYADVIAQGSKKLIIMVDELAELAKLEARDTQLQPEPFAIADLLSEVIARFTPLAERQQLMLMCMNCQSSVFCYADVGLIERVLQNLLENTLKNTPANGIIQVELSQPESGLLTISVQNPVSHLPDFIQAYLRSDVCTPERTPGSGLGLAIVEKILKLHDTRLRAAQPEANFIRFSFELPVYKGSDR